MHHKPTASGIGDQQDSVARSEADAVPRVGGKAQVPLSGDGENTLRTRLDHEQTVCLSHIQPGTGRPPEGTDHGLIGDPSATIDGGHPVDEMVVPVSPDSR